MFRGSPSHLSGAADALFLGVGHEVPSCSGKPLYTINEFQTARRRPNKCALLQPIGQAAQGMAVGQPVHAIIPLASAQLTVHLDDMAATDLLRSRMFVRCEH